MPELHLKNEDFLRKESLPLVLLRRDPQQDFPIHSHESSELVLIYRGSGTHLFPGGKRHISAGDIFLIHGKTKHGYTDLKDLALWNIMFDLNQFNHPRLSFHGNALLPSLLLLKIPGGGLHLTGEPFRDILSLAEQMEKEQISDAPDSPAMISALFIRLSLLLGRYARSAGLQEEKTYLSRIDDLLESITELSAKKWTREDMAKKAGMSISTLTRHFKERTGLSPLEYLIRLRLKKAAQMLQDPSVGIAEAADLTGFSDSNYFCRQFRKHFGTSPGKYRKSE
jgi:AraC-like DNA-binding protein